MATMHFLYLHANYGNFNLSHSILIQGRVHGRWKGWFPKFMGGGRRPISSERPVRSTSCDSNWSFHSLHGEIDFHLICCLVSVYVILYLSIILIFSFKKSCLLPLLSEPFSKINDQSWPGDMSHGIKRLHFHLLRHACRKRMTALYIFTSPLEKNRCYSAHCTCHQCFFPNWTGRTAAVRYRYTGPVQPGTTQNRMNSNSKSKSVLHSVWSGIPTGSTTNRSLNKKNRIIGEFDVFSNLN
jgi:hypothetical protein